MMEGRKGKQQKVSSSKQASEHDEKREEEIIEYTLTDRQSHHHHHHHKAALFCQLIYKNRTRSKLAARRNRPNILEKHPLDHDSFKVKNIPLFFFLLQCVAHDIICERLRVCVYIGFGYHHNLHHHHH